MKEEKIIFGILSSLCSCQKKIRCKVQCTYSDGMGCSIYSLCFYQSGKAGIVGTISFNGDTGKVCQYFYKGMSLSTSTNIVDLLLDLYNFEKEMLLESEKNNSQ